MLGGLRRAPSPGGPVAPAPEAELPPAPPRARAAGRAGAVTHRRLLLPPAPRSTRWSAEELAAEVRLAADSAADEAVLEELDEARPADDEADESLTPTPVTWDIDVETYNSHDRVQYYLDFFQGKGRERMGIWLTRMPRYEAMIRERLQREGLPGDLVYLALIESGFSNTATSRAKAVGMWQFMKAHGQGLRAAGGFVGGRAPRSVPRHRRRGAPPQEPQPPVRLAVPGRRGVQRRLGQGVARAAPAPGRRGADSLNSDATFFRLYDTKLLRRETKDYVPKLIAAALIAKQPARYGFRSRSGRARRLRLDHRADDDRARRDRPPGRHHRGRDPRAEPAVPPARHAAGHPVGRAAAAGRGPATVAAYAELPPRGG